MSYYRNGLYLVIVILFAFFVLLLSSGTLALEPIRNGFPIGSYELLAFFDRKHNSCEAQMNLNLNDTQPLPADEAAIAIALDSRKFPPVPPVLSKLAGGVDTFLSIVLHPDPTPDSHDHDSQPATTAPPKFTTAPVTTARPEPTSSPHAPSNPTSTSSTFSRTQSLFVTRSTSEEKDTVPTTLQHSTGVIAIPTTIISNPEPSTAPAPGPIAGSSKHPHSEIAIAVGVGVAIFFFLSILAGTFFFLRRRHSAKKQARMLPDHEKSILAWTEATSDVYFPSTSRSTSPFSSVQNFGSSRACSGYNYTPHSTNTHSKH